MSKFALYSDIGSRREIHFFVQAYKGFMLEHTVSIGPVASDCYKTTPQLFSIESSRSKYTELKRSDGEESARKDRLESHSSGAVRERQRGETSLADNPTGDK